MTEVDKIGTYLVDKYGALEGANYADAIQNYLNRSESDYDTRLMELITSPLTASVEITEKQTIIHYKDGSRKVENKGHSIHCLPPSR